MQREEYLHPRSFAESKNPVRDLVDRVFLYLLSAVQAVSAAHSGVQQAQVVVNLSGRGDGGSRVACRILLADGDSRCDAIDDIDIRLLDALQELSSIS